MFNISSLAANISIIPIPAVAPNSILLGTKTTLLFIYCTVLCIPLSGVQVLINYSYWSAHQPEVCAHDQLYVYILGICSETA